MQDYFLEMKNISKTYPGIQALEGVSLNIAQGEIHAICGETGAGKSALVNVLSGAIPFGSYSGNFTFNRKPCRFRNVSESEAAGIAVVYERPALVPNLSVAENLLLNSEQKPFRIINWNKTYKTAQAHLNRLGFQARLSDAAGDLPPAEQQLVSLARALGKKPKLLVLDEPTTSLNIAQADRLFSLLNSLRSYEGITILIVSHDVRTIAKVADKITVLRDGRAIETVAKKAAKPARADRVEESGYNEEGIIQTMVGRKLAERFPKRKCTPGNVLVEIQDWTVYDSPVDGQKVCDGVNIYVRESEVVGLAGLIGSGRSEFVRSIFGKSYGAIVSGSVFMRGKQIQVNSVRKAIKHHFAYISETLQGRDLFIGDSIFSNITIAKLGSISPLFVVRKGKERAVAEEFRRELKIRCLSTAQSVGAISAGCRQKVLLAKWLFANSDFLIMEEPTGGVDVAAKHDFYSTINSLVEGGKGVLLVSNEMPELLGMCDRIYVMSEGRIVGELAKEEASQEAIMDCILHSGKIKGKAV